MMPTPRKITKQDWISCFPFKVPREEQTVAINDILNSFILEDKKFYVADMPIGVGKSAVAVTVGNYLINGYRHNSDKSTFIVTTQKILQEQYKKDFGNIANISAKSNYICRNRVGVTCDIGSIMNRIVGKTKSNYTCVYDLNRMEFDQSEISLTNLHFFLNYFSDVTKKHDFRKLLVIDECHNLENVITDYVSLRFTKYFTQDFLKIAWPNVNKMKMNEFVDWIKTKFIKQFEAEVARIKEKMEALDSSFLESDKGISMVKMYDDINRKCKGISEGLNYYNPNSWVLNVSTTEDTAELKPLYASEYVHKLLYSKADKILLMSSTILNKESFCKYNGIPLDNVGYISLESPFPAENRPINVFSIGRMSKDNIKASLPAVTEAVKEILEHHKDDKGIIHCHTYDLAQHLNQNINSKRLLLHKMDDRVETLRQHILSNKPSVLVSPSFTEGVDLFGDLSRFQIIIKVPFPYLGDEYIRTKKDKVDGWYEWMTIKGLIQSYGRSIRDYDDHAETYILDSDFNWFYNKNKLLFPKWYREAVKF